MTHELTPMDQAIEDDANWLEDKGAFSRYAIGPEKSKWFCIFCGVEVENDDEPCQHCGAQ